MPYPSSPSDPPFGDGHLSRQVLQKSCWSHPTIERPAEGRRHVEVEVEVKIVGRASKSHTCLVERRPVVTSVLRLYDHSLPEVVSVDGSPVRIEAIILQELAVLPIAYSSTSLSVTQ